MRRQDLRAKKNRPRLAEASARLFYFFHEILRLFLLLLQRLTNIFQQDRRHIPSAGA